MDGAGHVPGQGQEHPEDNQDHELVVERGAERGGDGGVVGLESVPHPFHVFTTPYGPDQGGARSASGGATRLGGFECRPKSIASYRALPIPRVPSRIRGSGSAPHSKDRPRSVAGKGISLFRGRH